MTMPEADEPADALAAVTHPDPYPYYARLAAEQPFHRDDRLQLWIAAGADAVAAVLHGDLCQVRPPSEPVPAAFAGTPIAAIFGRTIRFTDGEGRCPFRRAVATSLAGLEAGRITAVAEQRAASLIAALAPTRDPAALTRFIQSYPPQVMASLVGVPADCLDEVVACLQDYTAAINPMATPADIEQGKDASSRLIEIVGMLLDKASPDTLLGALVRHAGEARRAARAVLVANGIGLMWQGYEAMAGLVGNSLLALARHPDVLVAVRREPALTGNLVQEVLQWDPPGHSTRRFVVRDGAIAGQALRAGDAILVLLAAATRDPAVARAGCFDLHRQPRRVFAFGAGRHACLGDGLAMRIAEIAVHRLLDAGLDPAPLPAQTTYRRSLAVRMPVFA
jgi:cytochrome P450